MATSSVIECPNCDHRLTDWVPRAELEAVRKKLHDLQDASAELSYAVVIEKERHQAELQRVATEVRERAREIVKLGCGDCSCEGSCVECIDALDLDAIVRGGK